MSSMSLSLVTPRQGCIASPEEGSLHPIILQQQRRAAPLRIPGTFPGLKHPGRPLEEEPIIQHGSHLTCDLEEKR